MIRAPVLVIPSAVESWRIDGAHRAYILYGCGGLWREAGRLQVLGLQGAGVLRERFLTRAEEAQSVLDEIGSIRDAIEAVSSSRGGIAVQLFDVRENTVFFLNDPIGAAPIYRYQKGNLTALSSDLGSLVTVLCSRGECPKRDPRYFAAGYLTGTNGYGSPSPYYDVVVVPRGIGIRVDARGEVRELDSGVRRSLYVCDGTYKHALDALVSDVLGNVRAASSCRFERKCAHLTGGFDSRLVLAAIRALGLDREFTFACIPNSKDWHLAKCLAGDLGLTFSGYEGNRRGVGYAQNYYEYLTRASRVSFGAKVRGVDPGYVPANTLLFQGGYGEVMRTFNSFKWCGDCDDAYGLACLLWKWATFPGLDAVEQSIWSQKYLDHCVELLRGHIRNALELGIPRDAFTNYLYVEGRNRLWIGLQSYYANSCRAQLDPLYSTKCVSIPLTLSFEERKANFVGLDLMRALAPELLEYPFDRAVVSAKWETSRGEVRRREFSGRESACVEEKLFVAEPKPWPGPVDSITDDDKRIAQSLGILALEVVGVRKYGGQAVNMIGSSGELLDIYNLAALRALWNDGDIREKRGYVALNAVLEALFLSGHFGDLSLA